jgi:hypothetical protein
VVNEPMTGLFKASGVTTRETHDWSGRQFHGRSRVPILRHSGPEPAGNSRCAARARNDHRLFSNQQVSEWQGGVCEHLASLRGANGRIGYECQDRLPVAQY